MTEAEWEFGTDPEPMLEFLAGRGPLRKFLLLACACLRRGDLDPTVEVVERQADGRAGPDEVAGLRDSFFFWRTGHGEDELDQFPSRVSFLAYSLAGKALDRWGETALAAGEAARAAAWTAVEAEVKAHPAWAEGLAIEDTVLETECRMSFRAWEDKYGVWGHVVATALPGPVPGWLAAWESAWRAYWDATAFPPGGAYDRGNWPRELAHAWDAVSRSVRDFAWQIGPRELFHYGINWQDEWGAFEEAFPAAAEDLERAALADLVRDVFGPDPKARVRFDPRWLTGAVVGLARGIYEEQAFGRLTSLAGALQDARCDAEAVLAHCRSTGPHARGCWVVDLCLGHPTDPAPREGDA